MKKVALLLLVSLFINSCQKQKSDFQGLGGLNIGENFKTLSVAKNFRNVMEGEFYIDQLKFSDGIGIVSDLNVSTENEKIAEVKFSNTEDTNMSELNKIFKNLEEQKVDADLLKGFDNSTLNLKIYNTPNKEIFFTILQHKDKLLKNGQPVYEFSYIHKDMMMNNIEQTKKIIGISSNKR